MAECDGFFERLGVPYDDRSADEAVHAAWSNFYFDPFYVKWLIQCWFDTVYGLYNGTEADISLARTKMAEYIQQSPYRSYEELIEFYNPEEYNARKSNI